MVRRDIEFMIGDTVISESGKVLTLTNTEAEQLVGEDQLPLLSTGTVKDIDALLETIGLSDAEKRILEVTAAERLARLDEAQREHAASLEKQVRSATHALLDQQRSLARSERLAATGELAASIAHELRNPLAGIQMTLSNLRTELDSAALAERVDLVIAEVMRLSRLLGSLLDTSHEPPEPPRRIDLHLVVDEMLGLTRYQLSPAIALENRIAPGFAARMPEGRLRQALLNLVLNAARALGESGGQISIEALQEGEHTRISVEDTGPGFPDTLLREGVQPFRSSRTQGTGGLGLPMVQRFARDLGGAMQLENRDPRGARVTLLLPSAGEDA